MKTKKHKKVNLEKFKLIFFTIGLMIAISITLLSFEWSSAKVSEIEFELSSNTGIMTIEDVVRTEKLEEPKAEPKKINQAPIFEETNEDDETGYEDINFADEDIICFMPKKDRVEKKVKDPVFAFAETMPEFRGGTKALAKFLSRNVKYPTVAREKDIQGKVWLRFVVLENGEIGKVELQRGVDPILDKEAIRVIKSMPAWKPGKQGGKKVRVYFTLPINFKLKS